jgi:hypothetical protein
MQSPKKISPVDDPSFDFLRTKRNMQVKLIGPLILWLLRSLDIFKRFYSGLKVLYL